MFEALGSVYSQHCHKRNRKYFSGVSSIWARVQLITRAIIQYVQAFGGFSPQHHRVEWEVLKTVESRITSVVSRASKKASQLLSAELANSRKPRCTHAHRLSKASLDAISFFWQGGTSFLTLILQLDQSSSNLSLVRFLSSGYLGVMALDSFNLLIPETL